MQNEIRNRLTSTFPLAMLVVCLGLAVPAAAQRSVPVLVENDASSPIPVALASMIGGASDAEFVLCMDNITGPGVGSAYPGCMSLRSLSLSVTRPGGPPPPGSGSSINIGIGEVGPVFVQKEPDGSSATIWSFGLSGNSNGGAQIYVLREDPGWGGPLPVIEVALDRSFVLSMTVDPQTMLENIGLHYQSLQLTTYSRDASGTIVLQSQRCWNYVQRTGNCSL